MDTTARKRNISDLASRDCHMPVMVRKLTACWLARLDREDPYSNPPSHLPCSSFLPIHFKRVHSSFRDPPQPVYTCGPICRSSRELTECASHLCYQPHMSACKLLTISSFHYFGSSSVPFLCDPSLHLHCSAVKGKFPCDPSLLF